MLDLSGRAGARHPIPVEQKAAKTQKAKNARRSCPPRPAPAPPFMRVPPGATDAPLRELADAARGARANNIYSRRPFV